MRVFNYNIDIKEEKGKKRRVIFIGYLMWIVILKVYIII